MPGTWVEPPQPELLWTPAWWGWVDGRYGFHPGYWGREVGFYGGIDYGFGYTGEGYYGGRWDHGVFFYNRTVNNFTNVRINNVYNERVVINNNAGRASFNGGNGGIQARPTPQQEKFARERHIEATPVQRQHAEVASKDRALFSKQNHGEPAIGATSRPGVLQGEGVVARAALRASKAGLASRRRCRSRRCSGRKCRSRKCRSRRCGAPVSRRGGMSRHRGSRNASLRKSRAACRIRRRVTNRGHRYARNAEDGATYGAAASRGGAPAAGACSGHEEAPQQHMGPAPRPPAPAARPPGREEERH